MQPPESVKWSLGHGEQDAKRIYLDREMHKVETIHNEIHRRTQKTKKAKAKHHRTKTIDKSCTAKALQIEHFGTDKASRNTGGYKA